MDTIIFYILSLMAVVCGILVVANPFSRNPLVSALFLLGTIFSLAGLFILLNAFFIAAAQILIYAGAVIVLFLFVLMLVDLKEEVKKKIKLFALITGIIGSLMTAGVFILTILYSMPLKTQKDMFQGDPSELGKTLFMKGEFLLPFEVISLLLLIAIVGAIYISSKENNSGDLHK